MLMPSYTEANSYCTVTDYFINDSSLTGILFVFVLHSDSFDNSHM